MRSLLGSGSSACTGLDLKSTPLGGVVSTPADLGLVLMGLQMQIRYGSALRWHLSVLTDGHVSRTLVHSSMYPSVQFNLRYVRVTQRAVRSGSRMRLCSCVHKLKY